MRPSLRPVVAGLVIALATTPAACTGGGSDNPEEDDTTPQPVVPEIERVVATDGGTLSAGASGAQLDVTAVASSGEAVVATATRTGADDAEPGAVLLHSRDGRGWEQAELPAALADGSSLADVEWTGDGFVAVGNRADGTPVAVPWDGDVAGEPVALTFPDSGGEPFTVGAVASSGSRLFVAGTTVSGSVDAPERAVAELAIAVSEDAGATWNVVELPEQMRVLEKGPALLERAAAGADVAELSFAGYDDGLVLAASTAGTDAAAAVWRSGAAGDEWTLLGTEKELFEGERLDLLHWHDGSLLAFTRTGGDAAVWRSGDGETFTRLDVPPDVFGGGGTQSADAAVTLDDGTLVAVGGTEGAAQYGQRPRDLELWVTTDLERWERALTDSQLGGGGRQEAAGVVVLAGRPVVVGSHQLPPTGDADAGANGSEGNALEATLPQHGASWLVSLVEEEPAEPPITVEQLNVSGIEGDVSIEDVTAVADVLVAVGWTDGEERSPGVWTSADGRSWERVRSPDLEGPGQVNAVMATDEGLVAVGEAASGSDSYYLGVWTSPDAKTWTRSDLSDAAFADSEGLDLAETADGLVAVGTADPEGRDYRDVGVWRSSDGGTTWSAIDTTREPFQAHDIEVLETVAVTTDGTLVAGGHTGTATPLEGNAFRYTPQPYIVFSQDGGATWRVQPPPFEGSQVGEVLELLDEDGELVAFGTAGEPGDLGSDEMVSLPPIAQRAGDEWEMSDERYRHRPAIADTVETPVGPVVVGWWYRFPGGQDALIGLREGGEFVEASGLLADGDQGAAAGAVLGNRLIVLGVEQATDSGTGAAVAWEVTWN